MVVTPEKPEYAQRQRLAWIIVIVAFITAVVVVVPTLVGAIALVVSGITGRFRPPNVMQAFTD